MQPTTNPYIPDPMHWEVYWSTFGADLYTGLKLARWEIKRLEDRLRQVQGILEVFEDYSFDPRSTSRYDRQIGLRMTFPASRLLALSGGNIEKLAEYIAHEIRREIRGLF